MSDDFVNDVFEDDVAQLGAGMAATGVAMQIPATASMVSTATGMLVGTKAGAVAATALAGAATAPAFIVVGGLALIGTGIVRVLRADS